MKINILSTGRFHLLDLARELVSQGHDVRFYSYVPDKRCADFELDSHFCVSLLWLVCPFLILERLTPTKYHESIVWYRNLLMDWYLSKTMRSCDICIALGTVYLKTLKTAKDNGSKTILEWGSKHIIEELAQTNQTAFYPKRKLNRELAGYEVADRISISSEHVKSSFLKHKVSAKKLLVNPYGVNLSHFKPTECSGNYDLLMVGGWSYRKGCDLLFELCKQKGYRLLHVGPIVDLAFPTIPTMFHHDAVDQRDLIWYYRQARVFVLPSRSEGLAMVQAQALVCGLPIVCSKETGGRDLFELLDDKSFLFEMESLTLDALTKEVEVALNKSKQQQGVRNYAGETISSLSWHSYGTRYSINLYN